MNGGVSHLESFDPKPALNKYAGKTLDESPFKKAVLESPYYRKNVRDFAGTLRNLMPKLYPLQVGFKKHGKSGLEVSDWWPNLAGCIDDVAVIGSSNMDLRSFALNHEVSMMLTGADIVARFRKVEDDYRALSRELTLEEWQQRSAWQRYLDNTMRLTAALQ